MNDWEEEHGRPCPHDYTFHLRLGLNGDLFYHCPMCGRTVMLNVKMLKRHIRYRLNKQQEKERAEQEQSAGAAA